MSFSLNARARRALDGGLPVICVLALGLQGALPTAAPPPPARARSAGGSTAPAAASGEEAPAPDIVTVLKGEAEALTPWVTTGLARSFLQATSRLTMPEARKLLRDKERTRYLSAEAARALPEAERAGLEEIEITPGQYFTTKYGSPLAYARVVDLLGAQGLTNLAGKRVLDFGYGTIGHLKLMAYMGADVVGVDVDPFLTALYSRPGDQGVHANADGGVPDGKVTLVQGQWPSTEEVQRAVGGGFDLFISKNTLKRGYIHPERETDPRRLVHLGVDDATYVKRLFEALNPGGIAIIYNLSPPPAPPEKPYIPWADGRCPFERELLEKTGFTVLEYDRLDDAAAREMARRLGWDKQGMNPDTELFSHFTILRKPEREPASAR